MEMSTTQETPLLTALEQLAPHDHVCSIYENIGEHYAVAMPFIRIGLERGERCIYVADDGTEEVVRDAMHASGIDVGAATAADGLVLALGGGAIERAETRDLLLAAPATLLIHLQVELATTLARCSGTESIRPILADQTNLATRYERRLPLYRTAHVSIPVDTLTPDQVTEAILHAAGFSPNQRAVTQS